MTLCGVPGTMYALVCAPGEALRASALDPIPCWRVERLDDQIFVREKLMPSAPRLATEAPSSVVIVGGGAAGLAAADMLRREGYEGSLTIVSSDDSPPVDRPNLSKDYLAGTAQEDWVPLRSPDYYGDRKIDLLLRTRVSSLHAKDRRYCLGAARHSSLVLFYWQQEQTQSICRLKAPVNRSSTISAHSLIARPSLPRQLQRGV